MTTCGDRSSEDVACKSKDAAAQDVASMAHHALWNAAYDPSKQISTTTNTDHPAGSLPIAMPWNASNVPITDYHIVFGDANRFGLKWNDAANKGLSTGFTPASIEKGRQQKAKTEAADPGVKELLEIRYRDAPPNWLPLESPWWKRDAKNNLEDGYKVKDTVFKKLDFENPQFQDHVVQQAKAAIQSGAVDGIMLDWYKQGVGGHGQDLARIELIQKLRKAIGPKALILINTNEEAPPKEITQDVNGFYMECTKSTTPDDWQKIGKTLDYGEHNARLPRINVLETWPDEGQGRGELDKMRATATLLLTHAPDGAMLFADPDGSPDGDHAHDFYPFYNTVLGKSTGELVERPDGSSLREFANGTVLYNPRGNKPVGLTFDAPRRRASTGASAENFVVPPGDGDIFLK